MGSLGIQTYKRKIYNLDMIISVGYRVNSIITAITLCRTVKKPFFILKKIHISIDYLYKVYYFVN